MKLNNKKLFQLHGWLGITLGLPLFVICLSGTFAVISPELDWLAHEEMRVSPPENTEPLSWGVLTEKIKEKYPAGTISFFYKSDSPYKAWQASVAFSNKDYRLVHIDPYTGVVQGETLTFNLKSFFRIFHKQFYILDGPFWPHGRIFVCVFALVLLGSAITGILFYKKWWRSLFRLRFKPWRKFWSDLHRLIGVWALLFSFLFGITGTWYLALKLLEDYDVLEHDPRTTLTSADMASKPLVLPDLSVDEYVAVAQKAFPELDVQAIRFNSGPGSALSFYGDGPAVLVSYFTNEVSLDPYGNSVLNLR
ncbi:MAG: PepSY domain-containing protein, partial [Lentisphaeraceae bacterium]|nr:PepSY domain-containing protein [Lentisphaeraceae bacterium]